MFIVILEDNFDSNWPSNWTFLTFNARSILVRWIPVHVLSQSSSCWQQRNARTSTPARSLTWNDSEQGAAGLAIWICIFMSHVTEYWLGVCRFAADVIWRSERILPRWLCAAHTTMSQSPPYWWLSYGWTLAHTTPWKGPQCGINAVLSLRPEGEVSQSPRSGAQCK